MGKTSTSRTPLGAPDGSPPRLWGKRAPRWTDCRYCRFTPTPVGKTLDELVWWKANTGSPPRLWGKLLTKQILVQTCRFTPTPVGKTLDGAEAELNQERFTPTPVGKTYCVRRVSIQPPVHPHACGENDVVKTHDHACDAVHPHACGENVEVDGDAVRNGRFTPTPVGKTHVTDAIAIARTVHPHACGENASIGAVKSSLKRFTPTPVGKTEVNPGGAASQNGSPPRLWGKRSVGDRAPP